MIARHAFGGGLDTQSAIGFLAITTLASLTLSYIGIKRIRIDQHHAWMLRAWFYLGSIITARLIMIIAAQVITASGNYFTTRPCAQLAYISQGLARSYPSCASYFDGSDQNALAIVNANFGGTAAEIGVALGIPFGSALWLSLALHAIGVEIYVSETLRG